MAVAFAVFALYGLGAALRDHVLARPRVLIWSRLLFGATFVALAASATFVALGASSSSATAESRSSSG